MKTIIIPGESKPTFMKDNNYKKNMSNVLLKYINIDLMLTYCETCHKFLLSSNK